MLALMFLASCATHANIAKDAISRKASTLAFDSVQYHASNRDSTYTCNILIDAPKGNDSMAVALKRFLCDELAALSMSNDFSDQGVPLQGYRYQGSLDRPQDIVDFYGHTNEKNLMEELQALEEYLPQHPPFLYEASIRKSEETDRYITFLCQMYCYLAGPHGSSILHGITVLKPSGEVLTETVDTTKTRELQPILRKGIVQYLRQNGAEVTEETLTNYLFIDDGIIPLPAVAPYLSADGLHFVYGQYEIGPYALGIVEFTVPYADILPYLTKEAQEA